MSLRRKHRATGSEIARTRQLVAELLANDVHPTKILTNGIEAQNYAMFYVKRNRERKKLQNDKRKKKREEGVIVLNEEKKNNNNTPWENIKPECPSPKKSQSLPRCQSPKSSNELAL